MIKTKGKNKIEYVARRGSNIPEEKAQIFGERIAEMIDKKKGKITTMDLLKDAELENSVFHNYFEWDNNKAATEYRLIQARHLLGGLTQVVVIESEEKEQRSFFNIREKEEQFYVTINTAVKTDSYRRQLISQIIGQMEKSTLLLKMFRQVEK